MCYVDDQESYASNEIAINWNAPLVFLLAGTQRGKWAQGREVWAQLTLVADLKVRPT